jgi:hypothetical protein
MPSTYSSLKFELIGTGEQSGTWGTTTNVNLGTAIEEAITGSADVTFASGPVTLTLTDTNGTQAARNLRLNLTGTSGGAQNLIVPAIEKFYIVNNDCADAITVKNSTGTGIAVPAGRSTLVYNNGTNVIDAVSYLSALAVGGAGSFGGNLLVGGTLGVTGAVTLSTALPVTSGGTGAATAAQAVINLGVITSATGSAKVPAGTTAQQDVSPQAGFFRFNTTASRFEGYDGTAWGAVGGGATGGGTNEVFIENDQNVTANYTIPSTKNAMTTGPITVNAGVTVTVSSGSRWVVL